MARLTPETGAGPKRKVLVVEDDPSVAKMLELFLRTVGFEVTWATTGEDALQILKAQPTPAVVLDLGLPDGHGGAVLEWLRENQGGETGPSPWVVISALDREDATNRYGPMGGRFLPKPFDPWQLARMLEGPSGG